MPSRYLAISWNTCKSLLLLLFTAEACVTFDVTLAQQAMFCSNTNSISVCMCSGLCTNCTALSFACTICVLPIQHIWNGFFVSQICLGSIQFGTCSKARSVCMSRSKPASLNPWKLRQLEGPVPAMHTGMAAASLGHLAAMPCPASRQAAICRGWGARWSSLLQLTAVASLMLPQSAVNLTSRQQHLQV